MEEEESSTPFQAENTAFHLFTETVLRGRRQGTRIQHYLFQPLYCHIVPKIICMFLLL
jgi:hypothetical protein